jgi:hypothetical protein|tara:strand:- start:146 stop:451 length:306 start_codon:yes stop_codon:yes gene_type:complete
LKIEEFRRQRRKDKILSKNTNPNKFIEDVYYKGFAYFDLCKAEKEWREMEEKQKIKSDIQNRRAKMTSARGPSNASPGLSLAPTGFGTASKKGHDMPFQTA